MQKNLIILAGGLNRRYEEYARFSKVILPFVGEHGYVTTCLKNSYETFNDFNNKYVIVDESFERQVKAYVSANKLDITVIPSYDHTNSYETIYKLRDKLPQENLLFVWSDIILYDKPTLNFDNNIIYTKKGSYRYYANDSGVVNGQTAGNVPGVYFLKNKDVLDNYKPYNDFVELFNDIDFKTEYLDVNLFELRDKEAYLFELSSSKTNNQARFFNKLNIKDGIVTKTTDETHKHLLLKEIDWYKRVDSLGIAPKLVGSGEDFLSIEYLDGYTNFYKVLNDSNDYLVDELILKLTKSFEESKVRVTEKIVYDDMYKELYSKVIERVKSVEGLILDKEENFELLIEKSFNILYNTFKTDYYFTNFHGDLNGSNTMIKDGQFKFIDPRNYFGNTVGYGPLFYELAKVYYCVYGYDDFNANVNYKYVNKYIYDAPKKLTSGQIDPYFLLLVGIIYVSLTSYISDNVMKVNIAYQYGIKLIKDALASINQYKNIV